MCWAFASCGRCRDRRLDACVPGRPERADDGQAVSVFRARHARRGFRTPPSRIVGFAVVPPRELPRNAKSASRVWGESTRGKEQHRGCIAAPRETSPALVAARSFPAAERAGAIVEPEERDGALEAGIAQARSE